MLGFNRQKHLRRTCMDKDSRELEAKESLRLTSRLAQIVSLLEGDLRGFGPYVHSEGVEGSLSLAAKLESLCSDVESIRSELLDSRIPYIKSQIENLDPTSFGEELNLHLGCGERYLPGWVNIDFYPAPLSMNLLWGLPFRRGSVKRVYTSHMLEHLYYPDHASRLLREIHSVLAPGGTVRIVVPDIAKWLHAYAGNDSDFFNRRRDFFDWWPENLTRLEEVLRYAGANNVPGSAPMGHRFGYDFATIEKLLLSIGFAEVRRCSFMQSPDDNFRVDNVSRVAHAARRDEGGIYAEYSLFVEARRAERGLDES
ncbi:class I SAM-dependent methyltransferase [Streptomyces virginiae]|uniref:class I SAM-dependent methyltransferase n=1 Tax=Streptomyces virginiae TaxID=1961 RepID=UPI0036BF7738